MLEPKRSAPDDDDGEQATLDLLANGELEIEGRLVDASNATLYCTIRPEGAGSPPRGGPGGFGGTGSPPKSRGGLGGILPPGQHLGRIVPPRQHCVYKPIAGERPLWDFPMGTLAGREVAAYIVSRAAGWDVVPPTVMRDGPFGPGMCQLWIDHDADMDLMALSRRTEHRGQ